MRKVDDVQHAINQRQAERDQGIDRAGRQAVQDGGEEDAELEHGWVVRISGTIAAKATNSWMLLLLLPG